MQLLHIGHLNGGNILDADVWDEIWIFPLGKNILWTSPCDSYGWLEWASANMPQKTKGKLHWSLELAPDARIAKVDGLGDLVTLTHQFPPSDFPVCVPNWRTLARAYDAFWLTFRGMLQIREKEISWTAWDCETVVVFNAAVVKVLDRSPR